MAAGDDEGDWKPGSFTKNFRWGKEREDQGLAPLYESIRIGFGNELKDVKRETFRERVRSDKRPDLIPVNFFLFNQQVGEDLLLVDELVFQALSGQPGDRFDKLALFTFNFSYVGKYKRARPEQRRPALWANRYILERVVGEYGWDVRNVDAKDIESFLRDPRYRAQDPKKVATNLNHLYKMGKLGGFADQRVHRWWVDSLFLALDRLIADRAQRHLKTQNRMLPDLLEASGFQDLTGRRSLEKRLAAKHLIRLYVDCGGRERFSPEAVAARTETHLSDVERYVTPNAEEPVGAVHLTNPRVLKSIPATCAMLAAYAGFEVIGALAMENFDPSEFARERTRLALETLQRDGVRSEMTAEELLRLTRGK